MAGQWAATKPSRSDDVLDDNEQARIANQVKAQFDAIAPKRPTKPNRSESDSTAPPAPPSDQDVPLPEFEKLRSLQSQSQVIFSGANAGQDEFVETQYYKQLDSVDKEHHTIGTGFIRVSSSGGGGDGCDLQLLNGYKNGGVRDMVYFRTNPATNDWIPNIEEDDRVTCSSAKPNRSESG
ncbi:uncharacterized protein LOC131336189 [Rhododendron vialii]|uniref:uncharacterized protein LOC131336189 n=1 Tax=Rhododendron vialii TaxID=182163 RepID=UPI00265DA391|nr:uncharacterized protein LOC131336189 [Rhododendron vialii]